MDQVSLFETQASCENTSHLPLAELLRPQKLSEVMGHQKIIGPSSQLGGMIQQGVLPSFILWGPPGVGKTTLAQAIGNELHFYFVSIVATEAGAKTLREIGEAAQARRRDFQQKTILFVDEIHRFNKSQQDVLLPFVEKGDFVLIGATTENPSYELNRALLSRCRVITMDRLSEYDLNKISERAAQRYKIQWANLLSKEAHQKVIDESDGDARKLLNNLELVYLNYQNRRSQIQIEDLKNIISEKVLHYDKNSDLHYDIISAFIKSIRGSDADAALYYLARMILSGEDSLFIARRLVILAAEDIGNADPRALQVAVSGLQALELIGMPEGEIPLAQVTTYLSCAPKSNASYLAIKKAKKLAQERGSLQVPSHLKSSPPSKNYSYPHDYPRSYIEQEYLPKELVHAKFYEPKDIGFEKNIQQYISWLKAKS